MVSKDAKETKEVMPRRGMGVEIYPGSLSGAPLKVMPRRGMGVEIQDFIQLRQCILVMPRRGMGVEIGKSVT